MTDMKRRGFLKLFAAGAVTAAAAPAIVKASSLMKPAKIWVPDGPVIEIAEEAALETLHLPEKKLYVPDQSIRYKGKQTAYINVYDYGRILRTSMHDNGGGLEFPNWQAAESARRRMLKGGKA